MLRNNKMSLIVLSIKDIQNIEGTSYSTDCRKMKSLNCFYINSKPYVLASDYFEDEADFIPKEVFTGVSEEGSIKILKVLPKVYSVKDIKSIFNCGQKQAYQLMDLIDVAFRINTKRYVSSENFERWLSSLSDGHITLE